jgi:glucosinolate gamma-glutamyl hydrolase
MLPAVAMVEAIVVVSSPARANLCVLLQCGDDSEYGRKAYNGYIEVFLALLADR